jgi:hypothetical protein
MELGEHLSSFISFLLVGGCWLLHNGLVWAASVMGFAVCFNMWLSRVVRGEPLERIRPAYAYYCLVLFMAVGMLDQAGLLCDPLMITKNTR